MLLRQSIPTAYGLAALVFLLTGCASSADRPTEELARANESIEAAEEAGAREYGLTALDRARTKSQEAMIAAERGDHDLAWRLAREAELDAELAAAQANHGKADAALAEINDSIDTLRTEIARERSRLE